MKNVHRGCILMHVYDQSNAFVVQIIIPAEWMSSNVYRLLDVASGNVPQSQITFYGHADKVQPVRKGPHPYLSVVSEFTWLVLRGTVHPRGYWFGMGLCSCPLCFQLEACENGATILVIRRFRRRACARKGEWDRPSTGCMVDEVNPE